MPAFFLGHFQNIRAEVKLATENLDGHAGEDELKKAINDENVEDILKGKHNTVEHSFQFRNAANGFQWTENAQNTEHLHVKCHTKATENIGRSRMLQHAKNQNF